mmetsp:Transcript_52728/g.132651  ORF Transcript_52728/g.132651 Transcript_52728/m.132651 type:complete len:288 (+) Transcript_52728:1190-2053(+)
MRAQKAKHKVELAVRLHHAVALPQTCRSGSGRLGVHPQHGQHLAGGMHAQSGGERRQRTSLCRLRGAEEQRLAARRRRQVRQQRIERGAEGRVQQPIRLVEHQQAEIVHTQRRRPVQVVQQPPRCAHQHRHAAHPLLLLLRVLAPDGETGAQLAVPCAHPPQHLEHLQRQLARGQHHQRAQPVAAVVLPALAAALPAGPEQRLQQRHQIAERLAAASPRRAHHIPSSERVRQRRRLHRRQTLVAGRTQSRLCPRAQRQLGEETRRTLLQPHPAILSDARRRLLLHST